MHGLVNKAIETFLGATYGADRWRIIRAESGLDLGEDGFEAMRLYEDWHTDALLDAAATVLGRSRESLLEDLGTFLISNPRQASLRRLLRFGGVSFTDFLYSLDDLPDRTRLAVPDLSLPDLTIQEDGPGRFRLLCRTAAGGLAGVGHVCVGVLRALADDYGALAVIEHRGSVTVAGTASDRRRAGHAVETISIEVHDPDFHTGRRFELAVRGG